MLTYPEDPCVKALILSIVYLKVGCGLWGSDNFNHIRKEGKDPHICKAWGRVLGGTCSLLAFSAPRPERCLLLKTPVYSRSSGVHSQDRQEASKLQYSNVLSFVPEVFKVHEMYFEFC